MRKVSLAFVRGAALTALAGAFAIEWLVGARAEALKEFFGESIGERPLIPKVQSSSPDNLAFLGIAGAVGGGIAATTSAVRWLFSGRS